MMKIEKCQSLNDIRDHIDALDEQIIPLLCERIQYVTQAAKFKETEADTRLYGRIEAIVSRARAYATTLLANPDHIESVYRHLIDDSIREERNEFRRIQADAKQHDENRR